MGAVLRLEVREIEAELVLFNPLGNGFFVFDCAASQPAKSGSPPSSYGAGLALALVEAVDETGGDTTSKGSSSFCQPSSSSSMAPQASYTSSAGSLGAGGGCSDNDRPSEGVGRSVSDCASGDGDEVVTGRGTDAERAASSGLGAFVGSISPFAAAILLVKEEIAHPAQELSLGVPIRAASFGASGLVVGGITVSAMVLPCFLTRCRYRSSVLLA